MFFSPSLPLSRSLLQPRHSDHTPHHFLSPLSPQVYGAFIDLGSGVNGLLHVSQISHDHVAAIDKVLNQGDKVKVLVLTHDRERGRISLSTKKLEPTPGDMLRDPALVFDRADEMAAEFRKLMKSAEAAAGGAASGGGGGGAAEAEVAAPAAAAPVAE